LHGDYGLTAGINSGHLQSSLNSFRARVPKEKRVERWVWHNREQLLDELEIRLMIRDAALIDGTSTVVKMHEGSCDDTWQWTRFKHWSAAALLTFG
jgi:hypothetical protein